MRLVDFETVLIQSLQVCGLDRSNVTDETFYQFRDFANNRLRFAYEYDIWPELVRTIKLAVTHSNEVHSVVIPNDGIITNDEGTFKVDIGTIMQVALEDPRTTGKVHELSFSIDEYEQLISGNVFETVKRLIITDKDASYVYVTYRINCPELVGNIWSAGTYYPGQQVYWAYQNNSYFAPTTGPSYAGKKGNFWKCITQTSASPNVNNNSNPSAGDVWEKVKIPAFLSQYLIRACHADWLRSEMQIEMAQAVEREAMALLDFEVNKAIIQQGVQPRLKFNQTY